MDIFDIIKRKDIISFEVMNEYGDEYIQIPSFRIASIYTGIQTYIIIDRLGNKIEIKTDNKEIIKVLEKELIKFCRKCNKNMR